MARWNSSSVRFIKPHVEEICKNLKGPFSTRQVYGLLMGRLKRYPTYREFSHGLHTFTFIERIGVKNGHMEYRYKG